MTIPNMAFTPTNGLRDTTTYPTVPASEADLRDEIQRGMDQLRDHFNNNIVTKALDKTGDTMTGNLGVGVTPGIQTTAGRRYLTIKGSTDAGFVEVATNSADGDSVVVGGVQAVDVNSTNIDKRITNIVNRLKGATANNRGGEISISTKADNGALTERVVITNDGRVLLNNHPMAEMVSGGYKVQSGSVAATQAGTVTVTFPTAFTSTPIIVVSINANTTNMNTNANINVSTKSTTGFTAYSGYGSTNVTVEWIAIGS